MGIIRSRTVAGDNAECNSCVNSGSIGEQMIMERVVAMSSESWFVWCVAHKVGGWVGIIR